MFMACLKLVNLSLSIGISTCQTIGDRL